MCQLNSEQLCENLTFYDKYHYFIAVSITVGYFSLTDFLTSPKSVYLHPDIYQLEQGTYFFGN
jgi:hypothetical protein